MFQDLEWVVIQMIREGVEFVGFFFFLFLVFSVVLVRILDNPESRFVYLANVIPHEK